MTADSWVYLHVAADGALLYIGKTNARQYRQRMHAKSAAWWPQVVEVDHLGPYDACEAVDVEAALIATHQPPNNIVGSFRQPEMYTRAWAVRRAHMGGVECGSPRCVTCAHSAGRNCLRRSCVNCRMADVPAKVGGRMTRPGTFPRVAVTIVAACLAGIVGLTSQTTPADAATGRPICSHGTVNISGDRYLAHSWDEREYAVRRSADGVWRRTWVSNTHHYDVMQRRRLRPAKFVAVWPSHGCPRH